MFYYKLNNKNQLKSIEAIPGDDFESVFYKTNYRPRRR